MPPTYRVVRFYAPHLDKATRTISEGLTLAQAQEHCRSPKTRRPGEWFDGYDKM